jgi:hypothetical protein
MQAAQRATGARTSMASGSPTERPHVTGAIASRQIQQLARTARAKHHRRTLPPPDQLLALLESL